MTLSETNNLLVWVLRFGYPALAVILWRRWVPGIGFLAYIVAAMAWVWLYEPGVVWKAIALSALTSPLELAATWEIARNFLVDDWEEHRSRVMRAVWIMGTAGTLMAWMLQAPNGSTVKWYTTIRAALHFGCFMMLLTAGAYAGIAKMKAHWLAWVHTVLWTGYLLPAVVGVVIQMHWITNDKTGMNLWDLTTCAIHLIRIGCMALWGYFALKNYGPSGGVDGGLSRSASR